MSQQWPSCGQGGFQGAPGLRRVVFRAPKFYGTFAISGVTKDSTGAPLANCTVHLFESATDIKLGETISDGSGTFTFSIGQNSGFFYLIAYKPGSPDVAGTTVNTLTAT